MKPIERATCNWCNAYMINLVYSIKKDPLLGHVQVMDVVYMFLLLYYFHTVVFMYLMNEIKILLPSVLNNKVLVGQFAALSCPRLLFPCHRC